MKICLPPRKKVRIEMLPLIDIVFLLLVFFIYAMHSMAVHRGMPVELPTSRTAEIDKKLVLALTVQADGAVYLDQQPVELEALTRILQEKAQGDPETGVLLFGARTLPYQKLFDVLDQISRAGLTRISLQAEMENDR